MPIDAGGCCQNVKSKDQIKGESPQPIRPPYKFSPSRPKGSKQMTQAEPHHLSLNDLIQETGL